MQSSHTAPYLADRAIAGVGRETEEGNYPAAACGHQASRPSCARSTSTPRWRFCGARALAIPIVQGKPACTVDSPSGPQVHSLRRLRHSGCAASCSWSARCRRACSSPPGCQVRWASPIHPRPARVGFATPAPGRFLGRIFVIADRCGGSQRALVARREWRLLQWPAKCYASDSLAKRVAKAWSSSDR